MCALVGQQCVGGRVSNSSFFCVRVLGMFGYEFVPWFVHHFIFGGGVCIL